MEGRMRRNPTYRNGGFPRRAVAASAHFCVLVDALGVAHLSRVAPHPRTGDRPPASASHSDAQQSLGVSRFLHALAAAGSVRRFGLMVRDGHATGPRSCRKSPLSLVTRTYPQMRGSKRVSRSITL